jgi:hypothetical protein
LIRKELASVSEVAVAIMGDLKGERKLNGREEI